MTIRKGLIRYKSDRSCSASREVNALEERIDNFSRIKKWKTFLSACIMFSSWLANDITLAYIHDRVPYGSDPLPDLFFSLFPECQWAIKLAEIFIFISLLFTFGMILLHQHCWIVARRTFVVASLCYFMRALCISVTQVPVPSRNTYCDPAANETSLLLVVKRVGWAISTMGLDLYNRRVLCGDLIFSGHTTVLVLSYMVSKTYVPDKFKWISFITQLAAICGPICILLARKHYTLDVLLAAIIAYLTFAAYHKMIDQRLHSEIENVQKNSTVLPSLDTMVRFMESDVNEPVKNKFRYRFSRLRNGNVYYVI